MKTDEVKITVALDVGTTHSGYAYSFTSSPGQIIFSQFDGNAKTPTCILVDKGKRYEAFGAEAERRFEQMNESEIPTKHKLFRNFKSKVFNNESLSKKTSVRDVSSLYVIPVFDLYTMTVHFLKNHLMRTLNRHVDTYSEDEVQFVLLVPTTADDRSKWFIRQVAIKTGIRPDRLYIALESEASSIWLQTLDKPLSVNKSGTRYILVNIGGGVADISVHASVGDGHVESLSPPRGGKWGGNNVDNSFTSFIQLLFGTPVVDAFMVKHTGEWFKLVKKYQAGLKAKNQGSSLTLSIPNDLIEFARQFKGLDESASQDNLIKSTLYVGQFQLKDSKLTMDDDTIVGMYQYTITSLCCELESLVQQGVVTGENISHVIVVGGMAESAILQDRLKEQLDRFNVVFPKDSDTFAMKGAILLGQNPSLVNSRILPLTYALHNTVPFDTNRHKGGATVVINGVKMCTENFHLLVQHGLKVKPGKEIHESDMPLSADDKEQEIKVVSCGVVPDFPSLVTHCCVHRETSFKFPLPFGCQVEDKVFDRCMVLGETELYFKITFKKGNRETIIRYLDFD